MKLTEKMEMVEKFGKLPREEQERLLGYTEPTDLEGLSMVTELCDTLDAMDAGSEYHAGIIKRVQQYLYTR